jgi:methylase of polypeptide subunit release factors
MLDDVEKECPGRAGVHEYAVSLVRATLPARGRIVEVGAGCGALALWLRHAGSPP